MKNRLYKSCLKGRWLPALICGAAALCAVASGAGSARGEPVPRCWAFLVGVDDYAGLKDLDYAGADQRALAETLGRSGLKADQIVLLEDNAREDKYRPARANIERELQLLLKLVNRGDVVLVGFSGHGVSLGGKSYLCPSEASLEDPAGTMLPLDGVYAQLQACPAASRLLLIDACRNDPRLDGERSATPTRSVSEFSRSLERPPEGLLILSSCGRDQVAWEEKEFGHGVFMHFMLEGLSGKAADEEGSVRLARLYEYAGDQTKKYVAHKFDADQSPVFEGKVDGPFELARIDRGPTPPSPLPRDTAPVTAGQVVTNSIGMKLALIPAGEFMMGCDETKEQLALSFKLYYRFSNDDEHPKHLVRITRPFYLGAYEVTRGQFGRFVEMTSYQTDAEKDGKGGFGWDDAKQGFRQDPKFSWRNPGFEQTDEHPVVNVSHGDALAFCEWLSKKEEKQYRLPTEAEWEYACRAGTTTRFSSGDDSEVLALVANIADGTAKAKYSGWTTIAARDGYVYSAPVGQFRANAFGVYDMHGNVWEWCSDWYGKDYYANSPGSDPQGPDSGPYRVFRGGGWLIDPLNCRSANRNGFIPSPRSNDLGFRACLVP